MSEALLVSCTKLNPALTPSSVAGFSDLSTLFQHSATFAERLIEYAGRCCYRSTDKMGHAPGFIQARIKEGHEDIIEHVSATILVPSGAMSPYLRVINRHVETTLTRDGTVVTANLRVWRDMIHRLNTGPKLFVFNDSPIPPMVLPILIRIAPNVFADIGLHSTVKPIPDIPGLYGYDLQALLPAKLDQGPMRVTLLGCNFNGFGVEHNTATFLFEGISRACTHQLVRHRLASFSQESQRYVELSKGGWEAIVPPSIAANPEALQEMSEFWEVAEAKYARLRALGIRKEDARFILPNAAETRIVVTMSFEAWCHFFWLRAVDKAAQWEIRTMAQSALSMLHSVSPSTFEDQFNQVMGQMAVVSPT